MGWWGKAAGGTVGFAFLGPWGALLGAAVGHEFDRGMRAELNRPRARANAYPFRETLLDATFSIMGHLAAGDGNVTMAQKRAVSALLGELQLDPARERAAWQAFQSGTARDFKPGPQLQRLGDICRGKPQLLRAFLDMQMRVALAEGGISGTTRVALKQFSTQLGISAIEFAQSEALARVRSGASRASAALPGFDEPLMRACDMLGVDSDDDDETVKRAYRRLMSRHHPDKLSGQDADEETLLLARQRTHEVRTAYETVMQSRRKPD